MTVKSPIDIVCAHCHAAVGRKCTENTQPLDPRGYKALNNRVVEIESFHAQRKENAEQMYGKQMQPVLS